MVFKPDCFGRRNIDICIIYISSIPCGSRTNFEKNPMRALSTVAVISDIYMQSIPHKCYMVLMQCIHTQSHIYVLAVRQLDPIAGSSFYTPWYWVPVSEYWGPDKMAAILQAIFSNAFSWNLQWKFRLAILVTFELPISHFTGSWSLTYRWFGARLQQFHPLLMHCSLALSHRYWGPAELILRSSRDSLTMRL